MTFLSSLFVVGLRQLFEDITNIVWINYDYFAAGSCCLIFINDTCMHGQTFECQQDYLSGICYKIFLWASGKIVLVHFNWLFKTFGRKGWLPDSLEYIQLNNIISYVRCNHSVCKLNILVQHSAGSHASTTVLLSKNRPLSWLLESCSSSLKMIRL